jgi:hypothetical protein
MGYLIGADPGLPTPAAFFKTQNKDGRFQCRTDSIKAVDPGSGNVVPWPAVQARYPDEVVFPQYADIDGSCVGQELILAWTTDIGTNGGCTLPRSRASGPSELDAQGYDWKGYKEYVGGVTSRRLLFRGQNKPYRLRTAFHRTGRADLSRFLADDISTLHRQLSAKTRHVFYLGNADENGAFFSLVQHHGYPTPLLDWTYSPYVAAYFAYRGISNEEAAAAREDEQVRIVVFDQAQWRTDVSQSKTLLSPPLHLSVVEFIAIENERMIPQQAASTVANMDDIESYVKSWESPSKKYLWAVDLPVRDRRQVINELRYMGITAGSLFPGLDGACEELADRNFEV